jgi:hypothetical protein
MSKMPKIPRIQSAVVAGALQVSRSLHAMEAGIVKHVWTLKDLLLAATEL